MRCCRSTPSPRSTERRGPQPGSGAVLNKVRVLTARPVLRGVLGQVTPRFTLADLFSSKRPILLANLAKGVIGPDSARLLGTVLLNQLWQTALGRQAIRPE